MKTEQNHSSEEHSFPQTTLEPEALQIIAQEEQALAQILKLLRQQQSYESTRFDMESRRASKLTAEYISAQKYDKYQLASDEAVSHGVRDMRKSQLENIDGLLKKPYFARLVLEELENGTPRRIECLLGYSGNPECRIVDWRRAPLAKLYYEYKEGEEYAEEIQGREREGESRVAKMKISLAVSATLASAEGHPVHKNRES